MIYLDYAATTPMSEEALYAFTETAKTYFGNPSSLHDGGTQAEDLVELARKELAKQLGCKFEGLYFTSGGSEGNFLALTSIAYGNQHRGKHIITSPFEHSSVQQVLGFLKEDGFEITELPVDPTGQISLKSLEQAIRKDTILATITHGNSEIGVTQNLMEIGRVLRNRKIVFHSDCVQTFGKIPLRLEELPVDSVTLSAHKIHGPKGVGAVYISPEITLQPLLKGVTHEKGFRQGTLNTPGIVSFITAASNQASHMIEWKSHVEELKAYFLTLMIDMQPLVLETQASTLPHFIPIRLKGIEGQYVMLELNRKKIAVSTGSACKAGQMEPSASLLAIGRSVDEAHELVRITLSSSTTKAEIEALASALHALSEQFYYQRS